MVTVSSTSNVTLPDEQLLKVTAYGLDVDHHCLVKPQSYLRYMDRGRLEAIEQICQQLGISSWLSLYTVNVYKISVRFMAEARMGDQLTVRSSLHKTSSHRAAFLQRVMNQAGQRVAEAVVELLFLDEQKQLVPVPEALPTTTMPPQVQEPILLPVPFNQNDHFGFTMPLRVYYEDTDAQGITYHVSYFNFCERAFIDYIRSLVGDEALLNWLAANPFKIVRQINRYMNATHLRDNLKVLLGIRPLEHGNIILDERIVDEQGTVCADLVSELHFTSGTCPLPSPLK